MRFIAPVLAASLFVPALVATAYAQAPATQAEARALIEAAAKKLADNKGITYTVEHEYAGAGLSIGGKGNIKFLRGDAPVDQNSSFAGTGVLNVPMLEDGNFNLASIQGKVVQWIDDKRKALVERPTKIEPVPQGVSQAGNVRSLLIPPFLMEVAPFTEELRTTQVGDAMQGLKMEILRDEDMDGVKCAVIRIELKAGTTERVIAIGRDDKLPRFYEQARTPGGGRIARFWKLSKVSLHSDWTHDGLRLKAPEGYATDIQAPVAAAPAAVNDLPPKPPEPSAVPTGGPQIGQILPALIGSVNGAAFDAAQLKGKPAIIVFWSPLFPASEGVIRAASAAAGDAAHLVGVACRTSPATGLLNMDAKQLGDKFTAWGGKGTLLSDADASIAAFSVRGFPTTVVVNGEGRVAGVFEGSVKAEDLATSLVTPVAPANK